MNIFYDIVSNMKRWTVIFRALANINRLKIIKMLSGGGKMNVGEIAEELKISFKATSNHLAILKNLDVLESQGAEGHVFYFIDSRMPEDFKKAINLM
ncbi:winged helix-turn-helix transcriptional regulator [Candidatus Wolfebacteria bacterium]|nr:winged helix-turn-helix transcriptional regulator [Candidatus Wolfebacteria bacterium]